MRNSRITQAFIFFVFIAASAVSAMPARAQSNASTGKKLTVERIYSAPSLSGTPMVPIPRDT